MSYSYSSYETTTRTTTINGHSTTTRTTTTTTGDSSSVVVRELTEAEVSKLSLSDSPSTYEISDDDRLTKYDFYSLMNSEDDLESESESESDIEYHWFPSLLKHSVIRFLDDQEQEQYMDDDTFDNKVQVIENTDSSEDQDFEEDDEKHIKQDTKKRHHKRHGKSKKSKRPKKSEQVPVEVIHIVL